MFSQKHKFCPPRPTFYTLSRNRSTLDHYCRSPANSISDFSLQRRRTRLVMAYSSVGDWQIFAASQLRSLVWASLYVAAAPDRSKNGANAMKDDLIYCEGSALHTEIPVHPAWLFTQDGFVVDRHNWNYGPREWGHCAGTAMGHSGNDSARVSSWLGNSETVCRRFYCVAPTSGKLWPFKW